MQNYWVNAYANRKKCKIIGFMLMQINNSYCKIERLAFNNIIVHRFSHSSFCILHFAFCILHWLACLNIISHLAAFVKGFLRLNRKKIVVKITEKTGERAIEQIDSPSFWRYWGLFFIFSSIAASATVTACERSFIVGMSRTLVVVLMAVIFPLASTV